MSLINPNSEILTMQKHLTVSISGKIPRSVYTRKATLLSVTLLLYCSSYTFIIALHLEGLNVVSFLTWSGVVNIIQQTLQHYIVLLCCFVFYRLCCSSSSSWLECVVNEKCPQCGCVRWFEHASSGMPSPTDLRTPSESFNMGVRAALHWQSRYLSIDFVVMFWVWLLVFSNIWFCLSWWIIYSLRGKRCYRTVMSQYYHNRAARLYLLTSQYWFHID